MSWGKLKPITKSYTLIDILLYVHAVVALAPLYTVAAISPFFILQAASGTIRIEDLTFLAFFLVLLSVSVGDPVLASAELVLTAIIAGAPAPYLTPVYTALATLAAAMSPRRISGIACATMRTPEYKRRMCSEPRLKIGAVSFILLELAVATLFYMSLVICSYLDPPSAYKSNYGDCVGNLIMFTALLLIAPVFHLSKEGAETLCRAITRFARILRAKKDIYKS